MNQAEQALQLLFKKLHPHLEDAAHALASGAPRPELERLHRKLERACLVSSEHLEEMAAGCAGELAEHLGTLSANLVPVGANYRQMLILVQLCLEEAPAELLPFTPPGCVAQASWGQRMTGFLARLADPDFASHARWAGVDPEVGDEALGDGY